MPVETPTYAALSQRLSACEAAANDGGALVTVDLAEIEHKPLPSPLNPLPSTDRVFPTSSRISTPEAVPATRASALGPDVARASSRGPDGGRNGPERLVERQRSSSMGSIAIMGGKIGLLGELAKSHRPARR